MQYPDLLKQLLDSHTPGERLTTRTLELITQFLVPDETRDHLTSLSAAEMMVERVTELQKHGFTFMIVSTPVSASREPGSDEPFKLFYRRSLDVGHHSFPGFETLDLCMSPVWVEMLTKHEVPDLDRALVHYQEGHPIDGASAFWLYRDLYTTRITTAAEEWLEWRIRYYQAKGLVFTLASTALDTKDEKGEKQRKVMHHDLLVHHVSEGKANRPTLLAAKLPPKDLALFTEVFKLPVKTRRAL